MCAEAMRLFDDARFMIHEMDARYRCPSIRQKQQRECLDFSLVTIFKLIICTILMITATVQASESSLETSPLTLENS
jgi:hypothetical protein